MDQMSDIICDTLPGFFPLVEGKETCCISPSEAWKELGKKKKSHPDLMWRFPEENYYFIISLVINYLLRAEALWS